jgi:hypothetical protein
MGGKRPKVFDEVSKRKLNSEPLEICLVFIHID